jgi:hypothetical protein
MSESHLADFISALNTDAGLKDRVRQAQKDAMANIRRQADAIVAVAAEEGFDLSEWAKRPTDGVYTPPGEIAKVGDCGCLTCCLVGTSTS